MIIVKKFFTTLALTTLFVFSLTTIVAAEDEDEPEISREEIEQRLEERKQEREEKREELQERLEEQREEREQKREEIQERNEERRASFSARLAERRVGNLTRYWNNLKLRILAYINRLSRLIGRIESRLAKLETNDPGVETESIHESVANANLLLQETMDLLNAADEDFSTMIGSEDPKALFELFRENISHIKEDLKEVHSILVHIIGDIRGLRVGTFENVATPTTEPEEEDEPSPTIEVSPTVEVSPTSTPTL